MFLYWQNHGLFAVVALLYAVGCAHDVQRKTAQELQLITGEMADLLVHHGSYDMAVPLLREAIAHQPEDPHLRRLMGIVLSEMQLYQQARLELEYAWRLQPNHPETASAFGKLYDRQSKHQEAEKWHRLALEADKQRAEYHNNLGYCLSLLGNDLAAVACYLDAIRIDPKSLRFHNNLGFSYARLGQYDEAFKSFERGYGKIAAWNNMGLAYEFLGQLDKAEESYEKALVLNHRHKKSQKNLAALRQRRKLLENATEVIDDAI